MCRGRACSPGGRACKTVSDERVRSLTVRLVLAIFGLSLGGCVCAGEICMPTGAMPPSLAFTTAGTPTTTHVLLPISCGSRTPTSVQASVLGPDNMSFAHDAGSPTIENDGFAVDVTFTP